LDLAEIKKGLSTEKLETYRQVFSCKSDHELIAVYMSMQSIMSHFFTVVQLLEVTLRNSIHQCATEQFDDPEWFKTKTISDKSKNQVTQAEHQCLDEVGAKYTTNDLVSRLPFGFWVHMLSKGYNNPRDREHNLWQFKFNQCFPNAKASEVTLNTIFQSFGTLNKFRNRLFHHEPAWKGRTTSNREQVIHNIIKKYQKHLEVIRYLSSSKYQLITALGFEDRFLSECDIANLKTFEDILLPPEAQND
jgi:hypothetical protein